MERAPLDFKGPHAPFLPERCGRFPPDRESHV
jgi:hypothetical protein